MLNRHKQIFRINTIVAKQCLWPHWLKKDFETGSLLSQSLSLKAYKSISTPYSRT